MDFNLLKDLCSKKGVSGHEKEIAQFIAEEIKQTGEGHDIVRPVFPDPFADRLVLPLHIETPIGSKFDQKGSARSKNDLAEP